MPTNRPGYMKEYCRRTRAELIEMFGGKCQNKKCGSTERLEFAHIKLTSCNGRGRGKLSRITDIKRHPDCYALLCHACHVSFDRGGIKL